MKHYTKEILADLDRLEDIDLDDPIFLLERIKKYDFGYLFHKKNGIAERFDYDYDEYGSFIQSLYATHVDKYFKRMEIQNDKALAIAIKEFALSFNPKKYDILVRLGDVEVIYQDAWETLKTPLGDLVNRDALLALAQCYKIERERDKIRSFFSGAFKVVRDHAINSGENITSDKNVNPDIYLALTQSIVLLPSEARDWLAEKVFAAYTWLSHSKRSYEANQVSGYVALYLTLFSKKFNWQILDRTINETGQNYQTGKFVMQNRYARWFMEGNSEAALGFFSQNVDNDHISYVIALLADLNTKKALPLLREQLKVTEGPVRKEVLSEAIKRLENQNEVPHDAQRMVWMFESISPTERALGAENNNAFIKRAERKHEIDTNVYETDDE